MTSLEKKLENFKEAVQSFKNSQKTGQDYLSLLKVSYDVMKPDCGLMWHEIKEVLEQVIDGKETFEEWRDRQCTRLKEEDGISYEKTRCLITIAYDRGQESQKK